MNVAFNDELRRLVLAGVRCYMANISNGLGKKALIKMYYEILGKMCNAWSIWLCLVMIYSYNTSVELYIN